MPNVPIGKLITASADLPAIAVTIRASASVALALETYGPRKSDDLAWVSDWPAHPKMGQVSRERARTRVGKDLHQFKERELDQIVLTIDDHANKSQHHRL